MHRRIATDLFEPRVVGTSESGVYVTGVELYDIHDIPEPTGGGGTRRVWDVRGWLVHYGLDGHERQRWTDTMADYVHADVVLRTGESVPSPISWVRATARPARGVFRLDSGAPVFECVQVRRWDPELAWCWVRSHGSGPGIPSELRRVTGELVTRLDADLEVTDVAWDRTSIYVYAKRTAWTIDRATMKRSRLDPPEPSSTLSIAASDGSVTIDTRAHPWTMESYLHRAAGLELRVYGTLVLFGAQWPDTSRRAYQLVRPIDTFEKFGTPSEVPGTLLAIDLMPPWIALHRVGMPITLVPLEELVAGDITLDGEPYLRPASTADCRAPRNT